MQSVHTLPSEVNEKLAVSMDPQYSAEAKEAKYGDVVSWQEVQKEAEKDEEDADERVFLSFEVDCYPEDEPPQHLLRSWVRAGRDWAFASMNNAFSEFLRSGSFERMLSDPALRREVVNAINVQQFSQEAHLFAVNEVNFKFPCKLKTWELKSVCAQNTPKHINMMSILTYFIGMNCPGTAQGVSACAISATAKFTL